MSMRSVVITGSSRGIGRAAARAFLDRGYHVIGTSTSGEMDFTDINFEDYKLELHRESSILDFVGKLRDQYLKIDGLINNAAILLEDWSDPEINMAQLRETFEVNVFGTIQLTEGLIPLLQRGGHVINVGSGWGAICGQNMDLAAPHYKLSKAALHLYTRLLAERLRERKINVSAFDPGWVSSDMGTTSAPRDPMDAARELADLFEAMVETGKFWNRGKARGW